MVFALELGGDHELFDSVFAQCVHENCVLRNSAGTIRFCCSFTRRRLSIASRSAHSMSSSGTATSGEGWMSFIKPLKDLFTAF